MRVRKAVYSEMARYSGDQAGQLQQFGDARPLSRTGVVDLSELRADYCCTTPGASMLGTLAPTSRRNTFDIV